MIKNYAARVIKYKNILRDLNHKWAIMNKYDLVDRAGMEILISLHQNNFKKAVNDYKLALKK